MKHASHCYDEDVRTTVSIPGPLLANAKERAGERGITLSALIEDALRKALADARPAAAPPFRLHTVRGTQVNPNLDLDRTSALIALDDEDDYSGQRS